MAYFNIVAQTSENIVVTEYEPVKACSDSYRMKQHWKKSISLLCEQGYEYLQTHRRRADGLYYPDLKLPKGTNSIITM